MKRQNIFLVTLYAMLICFFSSCTNTKTQIANPFEDKSYRVSSDIESNDDFFIVHFTSTSFQGQTVCNSFCGNYTLDGDQVLVSNFTSTPIYEKDNLPNDLLDLFAENFYFTIQKDVLILSRDQIVIDFTESNEEDLNYIFYDYTNYSSIEVDTTKLYIQMVDAESAKINAIKLFSAYDISIDTTKLDFTNGHGNIFITENLSLLRYCFLLKSFNQEKSVDYATICRKNDNLFSSVTNRIVVNSNLSESELQTILELLKVEQFSLSVQSANKIIITLEDIQTGYEPVHLANQLIYVMGIQNVTVDYLDIIIA